MQLHLVLLVLGGLTLSAWAADPAPAPAAAEPASPAPALGTDTVARVDGLDVPYDWFRHEFRSTFFRYGREAGAREKVFSDFLGRMILYADACRAGITNDPGVMARVDSQVRQMESYMKYQLAMARVGMIIEAHLEQNQLVQPQGPASDEEARDFFMEEIAGQPGAPASFDDLPPRAQAQVRERVGQLNLEKELRRLVDQVRTNMVIEINQPLVDQVPMPALRGDVPPVFNDPSAPAVPPAP